MYVCMYVCMWVCIDIYRNINIYISRARYACQSVGQFGTRPACHNVSGLMHVCTGVCRYGSVSEQLNVNLSVRAHAYAYT